MSSPGLLNFDELNAAIAGDVPTGINLRGDSSPASLWLQIKDARTKSRAMEKDAINSGADPRHAGDWKPSIQLILQALKEKSKDMDLVAWLLEAMTLEHGFKGLAECYQLAADLMEKYWDQLYPPLAEEGAAGRVFQFAGLNGESRPGVLVNRIYTIALTAAGSQGPYDYTDYKQAIDLEAVADEEKRRSRIERGAITLQQFNTAVAESGGEFYANLRDDLTEADTQLSRFETVLKAKANGEVDTPTQYVREALRTCMGVLDAVSPKAAEAPAAVAAEAGGGVKATGKSGSTATVSSGAIMSREEAFSRIREIAAYFRATEPQSPVSYALEQVIRWGKMPLPELLTELITDENPRKDLFRLVGLTKPEEKPAG